MTKVLVPMADGCEEIEAVIIIDSMSHEHTGDGGVLDLHDAELTRMAGDDYKKREACKFAAWIKPKKAHKRMMSQLLQKRTHLIFCLRAEPKMKMVQNAKGKMEPVSIGFQPLCDSQFIYEMTLSMMLSTDAPGIGAPIKLQEQHRALIDLGKPLNRAVGECLATWSSGAAPSAPPAPPAPEGSAKRDIHGEATVASGAGADAFRAFYKDLTPDQRALLQARMPALRSRCEEADRPIAEPGTGGPTPPVEPVSPSDVFVAQALACYATASHDMDITDFNYENADHCAALSDDQRRTLSAAEDARRLVLQGAQKSEIRKDD